MQALLRALWTDESGQDTTEYVLLVVLAQNINTAFSETGSILDGYVSS
jgi:Flp pilus assembly pilin Flp